MGHLLPTIQKMWFWFLRLLYAFHQQRGTEGGWLADRDLCRFHGPFLYIWCWQDCFQEKAPHKILFPELIYKIKLSLLFLFLWLCVLQMWARAWLLWLNNAQALLLMSIFASIAKHWGKKRLNKLLDWNTDCASKVVIRLKINGSAMDNHPTPPIPTFLSQSFFQDQPETCGLFQRRLKLAH